MKFSKHALTVLTKQYRSVLLKCALINAGLLVALAPSVSNAAWQEVMTGDKGTSRLFNETDGGGAKFENTDGTWSFVGVNNGGADGIAAQIYAGEKKGTDPLNGARLDVTTNGIYYTVGNKTAEERLVDDNKIVTLGTTAQGKYDNTTSGLEAITIQSAIDEVVTEKQDKLTAGYGIKIEANTVSLSLGDGAIGENNVAGLVEHLAAKQDVLTAGSGIAINSNEISVSDLTLDNFANDVVAKSTGTTSPVSGEDYDNTKIATVGKITESIEGVWNLAETKLIKELGYDTTTTDAQAVLGNSISGAIKTNQTDIATNKAAIDKLNGDATTEGSVAKTVKDAIDANNLNIYSKAGTEALVDEKIAENNNNLYSKTATDELLAAKANAADVYTKSATDERLAQKANVADVYSKTATDELLAEKANVDDVYSKTATDELLAEKADLAGDNTFTGTNTFTKQIVAEEGIDVNNLFTVDANGNLVAQDATLKNTTVDGTLDVTKLASLDGGIDVNDGKFVVKTNGAVDAANGAFHINNNGGVKITSGDETTFQIGAENGTLLAASGDFTVDGKGNIAGKSLTFNGTDLVNAIDTGATAVTDVNDSATTIATTATVIKSAENGIYTNEVGATSNVGNASTLGSAVADLDRTIGDMDFSASRYVANDETVGDAIRSLDSNLNRVETEYRDLRKDMDRGFASMAALSALVPNARATGNTQLSAGTGMYSGHVGFALGGFHWFTDNLVANVGIAYGDGSASDMIYRAGVTYSW